VRARALSLSRDLGEVDDVVQEFPQFRLVRHQTNVETPRTCRYVLCRLAG